MKKRIVVIAMMLALAFQVCFSANAAENQIVPNSDTSSKLTSNLNISSGNVTCKSTVTAKSNTTKIVLTNKLQKKVDGEWVTVRTDSKTIEMTKGSLTSKFTVSTSGSYINHAVAKIYVGSTYEVLRQDSAIVQNS